MMLVLEKPDGSRFKFEDENAEIVLKALPRG